MSRLRVGVVGCGAIAQIQHLPHLREGRDRFEIGGICDIAPNLLRKVGDDFNVPEDARFTDVHDLLVSDIDAVLICSSGSHAPQVLAAAETGKHVLVEKPACVTLAEARSMIDACQAAGVVLMVAYPKRYEPSYAYAASRVRAMQDVRLIQINHLHPSNDLHMAEFSFHRANLPDDVVARLRAADTTLIAEALGLDEPSDELVRAYQLANGSLIHDISVLHGMFGPPEAVLNTEIWREGGGVTTTLRYPNDIRAVLTWVDLPDLWAFEETFAVYGRSERVIVSFPTGFSRGLPTTTVVQEPDADGSPSRRELSWHENPFKRELEHFHDCIQSGQTPDTPGTELIDHLTLVRDIVRASFTGGS